jgi:hypothetical protein
VPIRPIWFDLFVCQGVLRHLRRLVERRECRQTKLISVGTQEVKSDETFHIPIVDFGKFLKPTGPGDRKATAKDVVTAFKEVGYVPSTNKTKVSYLGASPLQVCLSQEPWY